MITIKSNEEIEIMRQAGKIAYELLEMLNDEIKIGVTTKQLDKIAYDFISSHDATPSFLGYEGYPASICASVNEEVVHGIPGNRKLKNGDIISIDVGVYYKGYHSDTCRTYKVGHISKDKELLMKETKKALYEGIKKVKNGVKLSEVCKAVQKVGVNSNLAIYRELTGHGVGKELHEDPYVPNYWDNSEKDLVLKTGMVIAIEPMFGLGRRDICVLEDDWTIVTEDYSPAAHYEHTILVTDNGYEILTGE